MKSNFLLKVILFPLKIVIVLILPFFLLVRSAIFLHTQYEWNGWPAIGIGFLLSGVLLFIYMTWIYKKIIGKKKITVGARKVKMQLSLLIIAVFAAYGLLYLSGNNAKTKSIKKEYGALHPIVRVGISSVTLFDQELVITDLKRSHGDYEQMGIGEVNNSLHFKQSDGYVHAIDLRTGGRSEIRNKGLELWLRILGFRTLRHIGTADHLHVSLMIHEAPNAL